MCMLFEWAERCIKRCTWKDFALLKICLFALGLICGAKLPKKARGPAVTLAVVAFVASYIPLVGRFLGLSRK